MYKWNILFLDYWYYITSWSFLDVWKKSCTLIKITLTDKLKILDDKLKANKAHYDLNRAKTCTLLSKEPDKFEYLAGKDLEYKPSALNQAKLLHWVKFLIKD